MRHVRALLYLVVIAFIGVHQTLAQSSLTSADLYIEFTVEDGRIAEFERELTKLLDGEGFGVRRSKSPLPDLSHRAPLYLQFRNGQATVINVINLRSPTEFSAGIYSGESDANWQSAANSLHAMLIACTYCRITQVRRRAQPL